MINAATDYIERECGKTGLESYPNDGHFVQKTYTNEVYTAKGRKQERLVLRNAPVTYLIVTGNLTQGSANVTVAPYTGIVAGMPLYAHQGLFPQGTTVASVGSNGALTMSQPASVTQTGAVFEISGLISFQWRSGTPSNPNWTDVHSGPIRARPAGAFGHHPRLRFDSRTLQQHDPRDLRRRIPRGLAERRQRFDPSASRRPHEHSAKTSSSASTSGRQLDGKASEAIQGATTSLRRPARRARSSTSSQITAASALIF